MCVMSDQESVPQVGIREMRQNLSVYVDRVKAGETLEVTERGLPVARIGPIPPARLTPYQRMIQQGRLTAVTKDLLDIEPLDPMPGGASLTQTVLAMRQADRS